MKFQIFFLAGGGNIFAGSVQSSVNPFQQFAPYRYGTYHTNLPTSKLKNEHFMERWSQKKLKEVNQIIFLNIILYILEWRRELWVPAAQSAPVRHVLAPHVPHPRLHIHAWRYRYHKANIWQWFMENSTVGIEFKYFNPKRWFLSSRKYNLGCSSRIQDPVW
jgi:hypothetical protein